MIIVASAHLAKEELAFFVMAMTLLPQLLAIFAIATTSAVSPEFEIAMRTSAALSEPESPWRASAA
jgi:hypothetical protein